MPSNSKIRSKTIKDNSLARYITSLNINFSQSNFITDNEDTQLNQDLSCKLRKIFEKFNIINKFSINVLIRSISQLLALKSNRIKNIDTFHNNIFLMIENIGKSIKNVSDHSQLLLSIRDDVLKRLYKMTVLLPNGTNQTITQYLINSQVIILCQKHISHKYVYRFYVLNGQSITINNRILVAGHPEFENERESLNGTIKKFYNKLDICDKTIINNALNVIEKAKIELKYDNNEIFIGDFYNSIIIEHRILEILNHINMFLNNSKFEDLTINPLIVIHDTYESLNFKILNYLKDKNVIEIIKKMNKSNKKFPICYYKICGQLDPFNSRDDFDRSLKLFEIIQESPNGILITEISDKLDARIETCSEVLTILVTNNIIYKNENDIYYYPSLEERILFEIKHNNSDNITIKSNIFDVFKKIEYIKHIGKIKEINTTTSDLKFNDKTIIDTNLNNSFHSLIFNGFIEYDEDNGVYNLLKDNYNPYIGLIPDKSNGNNLAGNTVDSNDVFHYLNNTVLTNKKIINVLSFLLDKYYNKETPPTTREIFNHLGSEYIRLKIDKEDHHLLEHLFEIGLLFRYKSRKYHNGRNYALNPNLLNVAEKFLDLASKSSSLDNGFGKIEIHLVLYYIVLAITDNGLLHRDFILSETLKYLESIPEINILQNALELSYKKKVSIKDLVEQYVNRIDLAGTSFNVLSNILNDLKHNRKLNKLSFSEFGSITIDLRQFFIKNNGIANQAVEDFINVLSLSNPKNKELLYDRINNLRFYGNRLNEKTNEVILAEYIERFWNVFNDIFYGNNPIEMLNTVSLILHYCDNSLSIIDNQVKITPKCSSNTKYFDYLIQGLSIRDNDLYVVPEQKKELIDLLIISILVSTPSIRDTLGNSQVPFDSTGDQGSRDRERVGGHSDTAKVPPERWMHLFKFIRRVFGLSWWIPDEFKNGIGIINIEFKNSHSKHIVSNSQISYLLGYPDPDGISAFEKRLVRSNKDYIPHTNNMIAYSLLAESYTNKIVSLNDSSFLNFTFDVLSFMGVKIRSNVCLSRPLEYFKNEVNGTTNKKSAINIVSIALSNLKTYKAIDAIQSAFYSIYTKKASLIEIKDFFNSLAINIEFINNNSFDSFLVKEIEKDFLQKTITQILNPSTQLIKKYLF